MTTVDRVIRWAAAAAVTVVAAIAAVASYSHAYELVVTHGERGALARALPITVDGLIVTAGLVIVDCARQRRPAPLLAWVLLGVGIAATVLANVAHGVANGPVGAAVSAWPAVVAVGVFELAMRLVRGARPAEEPTPSLGVTGSSLADAPEPDPALATARDRFAEQLADGSVPSARAIRRELKVGHPKATRIRAALAEESG